MNFFLQGSIYSSSIWKHAVIKHSLDLHLDDDDGTKSILSPTSGEYCVLIGSTVSMHAVSI